VTTTLPPRTQNETFFARTNQKLAFGNLKNECGDEILEKKGEEFEWSGGAGI